MPGQHMDQRLRNGGLQKRSMRISGNRTSLALEAEYWTALEAAARNVNMTLPVLVAAIDKKREQEFGDTRSLASAVRVYLLQSK